MKVSEMIIDEENEDNIIKEIDKITKVDDAIELYAIILASDTHKGRIEIHEKLCELLHVDKKKFAPFEGILVGLGATWTPEMCKYLILKEIERLKLNRKKR